MHHRTTPLRQVGVIAALLTMATALVLVPAGQPASAVAGVQFDRFAGSDRYETARLTAEATFAAGTQTAILATGEQFPDALAGNYLAGVTRAPILLTRTGSVPSSTKTALNNLKVKNVIILGGTDAVSAAVEAELKSTASSSASGGNLEVTRLAGTDRYETARVVAVTPSTTGTVGAPIVATQTVGRYNGKRTAIVATGDRFPDALVAGPMSYALQFPILLTPNAPSATLHEQTRTALRELSIEHVFIFGGTEAVSAGTEAEIKSARGSNTITTERLEGEDRTETARDAAEFMTDPNQLRFSKTHVNLARGDNFPDALTGGPHGGEERTPILLTASSTTLSTSPDRGAERYLRDNACTITSGHIYGGTEAVSTTVETQAETAAGTCTGPGGGGAGLPPTTRPELQSVAFVRTVVNDAGTPAVLTDDFEQSTYRFTFDESVTIVQANPPTSTGAGAAALFHVVPGQFSPTTSGQPNPKPARFDGQLAASEPGTTTAVLVAFGTRAAPVGTCNNVLVPQTASCTPTGELSLGTVDEGAVRDQSSQLNAIGAAPINGGARVACTITTEGPRTVATVTAGGGETSGPDLCQVEVRAVTTDPLTGEPTASVAIYTFDHDVSAATPARFFLYQADGTESPCNTATAGEVLLPATPETQPVKVAGTGPNTVTCSTFERFTNAQILTAVLGAVDDEAVTPQPPEGAPAETPPPNPEGAQPVLGSTGTPRG